MYEYPNASGIDGLLSYPTQASPNFWFWILGGLWVIFSLSLYYAEVKLFGRGKLLSSIATSGFFIVCLALIGSTIGFITTEILVYIIVLFSIFTAIFFFTGKDN